MCREGVNLGLIYLGTLVGAGFMSGREIMIFFSAFGKDGLKGLAIACVLFFVLGYMILKGAIINQSISLRDILVPISGERLMDLFEMCSHLFLAASYYIMLSGSASVLKQGFGIPYTPSVLILACIVSIWLSNGLKGLAKVNSVMVPLILLFAIMMFFRSNDEIKNLFSASIFEGKSDYNYVLYALGYVSYNMMTGSMVLASLGRYTKRRIAAFGAALLATAGLFIVGVIIWALTTVYYERLRYVEVPLVMLAKNEGPIFNTAAVVAMLFAMLTTAVGVGYAFISSFSHKLKLSQSHALLFLALGLPITYIGFSSLVGLIYPLFGVIGVILIILIGVRRFLNIKIE